MTARPAESAAERSALPPPLAPHASAGVRPLVGRAVASGLSPDPAATDPSERAEFLRYAVPHIIRSLRTRPLRAALLADLIRRRNR